MYRRFLEAVDKAYEIHKNTLRGDRIKVLKLLGSHKDFKKASHDLSDDFLILNEVLIRLEHVDPSLNGNHRFAYFRSLLKTLGFSPRDLSYSGDLSDVQFILSIIKQILNFEYMDWS